MSLTDKQTQQAEKAVSFSVNQEKSADRISVNNGFALQSVQCGRCNSKYSHNREINKSGQHDTPFKVMPKDLDRPLVSGCNLST